MDIIVSPVNLVDPAIAGNKAASLARLSQAGFAVPPFFVIDGRTLEGSADSRALGSRLADAAARIADPRAELAVRSSAVDEDGGSASFAGQYDSFLGVAVSSVMAAARKVLASAGNARVRAYRDASSQAHADAPPAVIVQRMVASDTAGVAFATDPVSGNGEHAVVAAARGTGDRLVSGAVQGDTWRVDPKGRILSREISGDTACLDDAEIRRVAELVRRASRFAGKPQDIEWAFEGGALFLLQSRAITTTARNEGYALWDNSNIVESYGGVTTPLTFSVAKRAYSAAYRHLGRMIGISERDIRRHEQVYEQMIGLIRGRVYYNLLSWYRLLMLTPGFRFNGRFMEQMMGVTEALPAGALPREAPAGRLAKARAAAGLVRVGARLCWRLVRQRADVRRFHRDVDEALAPADLEAMSAAELLAYYEGLQSRVIPAWDTPLVNDLYCMVFHGLLRRLCSEWLGAGFENLHNDLVCGGAGIVSLEPVARMRAMAELARRDAEVVDAFCAGNTQQALRLIAENPELGAAFREYLERFGDRCLDELKLESSTLREDPASLLRAVGQLARQSRERPAGAEAPDRVADLPKALQGRPIRRWLFERVLRQAAARIRDRENMRFERTRVYGRVRAIFVAMGRRFANSGVLERQDDIFYLDVAEITGLIRGTGSCCALADIAALRRREFAAYMTGPEPPRRFATHGPAQLESSIRAAATSVDADDSSTRRGQGCSGGVVRGVVRVVRDPQAARIEPGDILVAERTDPGWVTIFPLVSGMIMERGSLLSHSAIVARELGIPAVVSVADACVWLADGDVVELDGAAGTVTRVTPAGQGS